MPVLRRCASKTNHRPTTDNHLTVHFHNKPASLLFTNLSYKLPCHCRNNPRSSHHLTIPFQFRSTTEPPSHKSKPSSHKALSRQNNHLTFEGRQESCVFHNLIFLNEVPQEESLVFKPSSCISGRKSAT